MKKLIVVGIAILTAVAGVAQRPLLVGHRGSLYGVENTVESFTNGAKRGYEYLETDFKVTKDKQFVCTHDDDISRLSGSSLTIAGSTLEELQAVPFTQTRSGVTYTGRLCSAQEYLDVCKEYNVRPLIELKWATGINSNDCSNIPMLIKFIEDNGFRDKCIILTSMKPCLEYIRKNYPDIELQFLTGQYWANHFDWCVELGIDVDIQSGYFDKTTVEKYHDAGLKVNMWTTNTADGYKTYGNMGCDFITTDYLDPKNLPDLDPSVTFPPNTVDYPRTSGAVKGNYETETVADMAYPAALQGRTVRKALMNAGEWVVLSFDAQGNDGRIDRIDPATGNITATYATQGVDKLGDIAFTADGILVASNDVNVPFAGGGDVFTLYTWTDVTAAPTVFYSTDTTPVIGNWTNGLTGKHIAVSGRLADLKVYLGTQSATATAIRPVGLWFQKGTLFKTYMAKDAAYTSTAWGDGYTITVSPTNRDCIVVDSPVMTPVEYCIDWAKTGQAMTVYHDFGNSALTADVTGLAFHRRAGKVYAAYPSRVADSGAYTATLYDVTDGFAAATPATAPVHEGVGDAPAHYNTTAFSTDKDGELYVHLFAQDMGMATVKVITATPVPEVESVDLDLACEWIYSVSTGNAPANIDGTDAQQGTAVNGRFYVNNCNEKKIHIFDRTGYLGGIPGGSGWGCARDDAGNIVVRDDKLTGTTHHFIVYPAGATPEAYGEPVSFTAEVKLEGQTNFINASGNLLGGTGHIYMYPNKQNAVNVITLQHGAVVSTKAYTDLKVAGTTAGYVIPVNDDSENWIYQVRGNGLYFYNGGVNTDLSTSRASTTAPARNSTGGGAYFTLRGNNLLVHNSGSNYVGGFTLRNLSAGTTDAAQVVKSVAPIGDKGYSTGGNYSTFNWLIPEKVDDNTWTLYQYCPANGIAMYTVKDKLNSVRDIDVSDRTAEWTMTVDRNNVRVSGVDVRSLRVYNVAGVLVAQSATDTADIQALAPGMYILRVNGGTAKKFVK